MCPSIEYNKSVEESIHKYNNIIIKLKNKRNIISMANIISYTTTLYNNLIYNNYKLTSRFYKIYSFKNRLPFEFVNKLLVKKFPIDIAYKIRDYYLKNDVSFSHVTEHEKGYYSNTLKIVTDIKYCLETNLYKSYIDKSRLDISNNLLHKDIYFITSKMIDSFVYKLNNSEKILNKKNFFVIKNKDKDIEFFISYKIYNTNIGWGLSLHNYK